MSGIALPQDVIAPIVAGYAATAPGRTAGTIEFVVRRAIAHGIVDCDLFTWTDRPHRHDSDLSVEAGVRIASVVDVIRRLVRRKRGEIEAILDLDGVTADVLR